MKVEILIKKLRGVDNIRIVSIPQMSFILQTIIQSDREAYLEDKLASSDKSFIASWMVYHLDRLHNGFYVGFVAEIDVTLIWCAVFFLSKNPKFDQRELLIKRTLDSLLSIPKRAFSDNFFVVLSSSLSPEESKKHGDQLQELKETSSLVAFEEPPGVDFKSGVVHASQLGALPLLGSLCFSNEKAACILANHLADLKKNLFFLHFLFVQLQSTEEFLRYPETGVFTWNPFFCVPFTRLATSIGSFVLEHLQDVDPRAKSERSSHLEKINEYIRQILMGLYVSLNDTPRAERDREAFHSQSSLLDSILCAYLWEGHLWRVPWQGLEISVVSDLYTFSLLRHLPRTLKTTQEIEILMGKGEPPFSEDSLNLHPLGDLGRGLGDRVYGLQRPVDHLSDDLLGLPTKGWGGVLNNVGSQRSKDRK